MRLKDKKILVDAVFYHKIIAFNILFLTSLQSVFYSSYDFGSFTFFILYTFNRCVHNILGKFWLLNPENYSIMLSCFGSQFSLSVQTSDRSFVEAQCENSIFDLTSLKLQRQNEWKKKHTVRAWGKYSKTRSNVYLPSQNIEHIISISNFKLNNRRVQ